MLFMPISLPSNLKTCSSSVTAELDRVPQLKKDDHESFHDCRIPQILPRGQKVKPLEVPENPAASLELRISDLAVSGGLGSARIRNKG